MSTSIYNRYLNHYIPLVQEFGQEVEGLGLNLPDEAAQPFFPLFGKGYERSSLRMAIVGQDTAGWGCLKSFLAKEKASPGTALADELDEFREETFTAWGGTRYTFWGFAMMFLAAVHGRSDWGVMKQGACSEILSSFIWGNGNAIEYFGSSPKNMPPEQWELIRKAGERFNLLRHLVETVRPRVVVVLWKQMNPSLYFAGYDYTEIEDRDGVRHYRIASEGIDIFHVPHPVGMRWGQISADDYCARLIARLQANKLTIAFPSFVQQTSDSENVIEHLRNSAPASGDDFTKFQFVEWVAEELKKRESFMSATTLAQLLNDLGYRTNYGSEYEGARGTYNLISGTYHRLDRDGKGDRARMVAEAFRKPNFEYAYEV